MNNLLSLKSFLQFLKKNKLYTFIEIVGFSISMMFVILIATYTVQELSTDNFQINRKHIYALASENSYGSTYRLAERLQERYPEIEKTCVITSQFRSHFVSIADMEIKADLLLVDTTFFTMFSFELKQGDRQTALQAENYVLLSESFARKTFGNRNPLGEMIIINNTSWIVNGIMKDIKNSVIPYGDILLRMDNVGFFNPTMDDWSFSNYGNTVIYVQSRPGTIIQSRETDLTGYLKEVVWLYRNDFISKAQFIPLKKIYFSDRNGGVLVIQGDKKFVLILASVGLLILLFAVINYINLTVAQAGFRAKEVATRQLLGSSRGEIFIRLIQESTLLTFLSFFIGIILSFFFLPMANDLLQTNLDLAGMFSPVIFISMFMMLVLIGVLAGLLPAILISGTKPIDIIKGTFRARTKMVFSKFFIIFQNFITITMAAVSITMIWQLHHLIHAPLGYNTKNIMDINVGDLSKDKVNALFNELNQLSSVRRVAYSDGNPLYFYNNHTMRVEGRFVGFQKLVVDPVFVDMYGIQFVKDNVNGQTDAYYFSRQALWEVGATVDDPVVYTDRWTIPVAGVIEDIYLNNITTHLQPVLIQVKSTQEFISHGAWNLSAEIQGSPYTAYKQIKEVYERVTSYDFKGEYLDAIVARSFESQKRIADIVFVFAFIAAIISMLGLLAMSTYFIQQRTREVAVRKVFGSTNGEVLVRIVLVFFKYVGIAFILSVPVIKYWGDRWLSVYTYRIPLSPLIFIAAGFFCLLLSFLTVYNQSRRAANANPALSIKAE